MDSTTMLDLTMDITTPRHTMQGPTTVTHHNLIITAMHAHYPTEHQLELLIAQLLTEEVIALSTDHHLMAIQVTEDDLHTVMAAVQEDYTEHIKAEGDFYRTKGQ